MHLSLEREREESLREQLGQALDALLGDQTFKGVDLELNDAVVVFDGLSRQPYLHEFGTPIADSCDSASKQRNKFTEVSDAGSSSISLTSEISPTCAITTL